MFLIWNTKLWIFCICWLDWTHFWRGFEDASPSTDPRPPFLITFRVPVLHNNVQTGWTVSTPLSSHKMFLIRDANWGFAFENCQGNVWKYKNSYEVDPDQMLLVPKQALFFITTCFVRLFVQSFISYLIHFFIQPVELFPLWSDFLARGEFSCRWAQRRLMVCARHP